MIIFCWSVPSEAKASLDKPRASISEPSETTYVRKSLETTANIVGQWVNCNMVFVSQTHVLRISYSYEEGRRMFPRCLQVRCPHSSFENACPVSELTHTDCLFSRPCAGHRLGGSRNATSCTWWIEYRGFRQARRARAPSCPNTTVYKMEHMFEDSITSGAFPFFEPRASSQRPDFDQCFSTCPPRSVTFVRLLRKLQLGRYEY